MTDPAELPAFAVILAAALLIGGAAVTLVGSLGLLRLSTFFQRVHAPTLGTTLGTACVSGASMIYFSALGTRPVLHELLILMFVAVTTPISLMILVRAAVLRDETKNDARLRGTRKDER